MHASYFARACAGATVTFVVGCSASSSEPELGTSTDALRALNPTEIVGDLHYGETSAAVAYTENPKYRAFRFQGHAGDAIDAWVRGGASGDARAWLLDASFRNVVSNDNASASTLDSHLVVTLTQRGPYYVAFREATGEDASFTVSLNGTTPSPTCDPEEENCGNEAPGDPFAAASCNGPPITVPQAEARFALASTKAALGTAKLYVQSRDCVLRSAGPECTAWVATPSREQTLNLTMEQLSDGRVLMQANATSSMSDGYTLIYAGESKTAYPVWSNAFTHLPLATAATFTNTCFRVGGLTATSRSGAAVAWWERRGVILGGYGPR